MCEMLVIPGGSEAVTTAFQAKVCTFWPRKPIGRPAAEEIVVTVVGNLGIHNNALMYDSRTAQQSRAGAKGQPCSEAGSEPGKGGPAWIQGFRLGAFSKTYPPTECEP